MVNSQHEQQLLREIVVLQAMIRQLPNEVGQLFSDQLEKIVAALNTRDRTLRDLISTLTDDAILEIKFQEFDLDVTRKERDHYKEIADDKGY